MRLLSLQDEGVKLQPFGVGPYNTRLPSSLTVAPCVTTHKPLARAVVLRLSETNGGIRSSGQATLTSRLA